MSEVISRLLEAWGEPEFWEQTWLFLSMVLQGLGVALLLGIPAGILLAQARRVAGPVIAALALLQTFPSLALLGLLLPLIGIGARAAVFLSAVYGLFPIVMNTYIGITEVSPSVKDAARGMGMTAFQSLWTVELPLALPVILAGVRTGAVYAIGIVTICALAGAPGLGQYIVRGMPRGDNFLIATGAIPLLLLTLLLFWALGGVAWLSRKNSRLGLMMAGGLTILLAGYALAEWVRPRGPEGAKEAGIQTVRLGSKNFIEGEILTQICKEMLERYTPLKVEVVENLMPSVIYKALVSGEIDLYPEYTGNLLTNKEALDLPVPADKSVITGLVRREMRRRFHLVLLDTFGLNNTYALCLRKPLARQYHLEKISDLRHAPALRVAADLDFRDRPDGWQGLVRTYGLHLPPPRLVAPELRYRALQLGEADIVIGFATDWEIAAYDLKVLADDKGYFPNYHGAPLVRADVLRRHPEIGTVLDRLKGRIDDQTMRHLNAEVAEKHRTAQAVAHEFLMEHDLLK